MKNDIGCPIIIRENLGYDEYGNNSELLAEVDRKRLETGDWYRASQDVECEKCGLELRLHPRVQGALYLHRICNGDLVKF